MDRPTSTATALLFVVAFSGCGGKDVPPDVRLKVTATPAAPIERYGQFVTIRFDVTNESEAPVLLERVDGLVGRRRELANFRGVERLNVRAEGETLRTDPASGPRDFPSWSVLLDPGRTFGFDARLRAIRPGEDLVYTVIPLWPDQIDGVAWLPAGDGRWRRSNPKDRAAYEPGGAVLIPPAVGVPESKMVRLTAAFPIPDPPFDASSRLCGAWTWSESLRGFVVRVGPGGLELVRKDGLFTLPPLPFDLLDDLDASPEGVRLIGADGEVRRVMPDEAMEFLTGIEESRQQVRFSSDPEQAPYIVTD